jgi:hypothetical protein
MQKTLILLSLLIYPALLFAQEVVEEIADDLPWYYSGWLWFIVMVIAVSIILIVARTSTKNKINKNDKM